MSKTKGYASGTLVVLKVEPKKVLKVSVQKGSIVSCYTLDDQYQGLYNKSELKRYRK